MTRLIRIAASFLTTANAFALLGPVAVPLPVVRNRRENQRPRAQTADVG
jgi:hypothetical protein